MSKRSPWLYIGCSCLALVLLAFGSCAMLGFYSFQKAAEFGKELEDPVARNARAREILHAETLPESYTAQFFLSIPLIGKFVILTDGPEGDILDDSLDGEHHHVFVYARFQRGIKKDDLRRVIEGEATLEEIFGDANVEADFELDAGETLARGEFALGERQVTYLTQQGELEVEGEESQGIYSVALIDCPDSKDVHLGFWFHDQEAVESSHDPQDEAALAAILEPFKICGR